MTSSDWIPTACILCECNCGLEVQLGGEDGRRFTKLRGDKKHPGSRGYACEKPQRLDHYQNARDRLTTPLRRRPDGTHEPIDWDTAIREVAARLKNVQDTHGGESIFYYGGGGQGNHLPGAYATATRRALGSRYRSSALAQEKTGEFWIGHRMLGSMTRADFEHCDVAFFLGKNPWHSHSIARARVTLKAIAKDPERTMIVVDPRRTETAELADIHLQVKPGGDPWLMSALLALVVEHQGVDQAFLDAHARDGDAARVLAAISNVDVARACARAGVEESLVRQAAVAIAGAKAFASMEDLGVQMSPGSTLVSYLHRLLVFLTGSMGKPGTHYVPNVLVDIANGAVKRNSPVVGAPLVGGLVPCNMIAEEILTDHDARYRAMIVEAANPAHSLADSQRMWEALESLDTLVVIDVAMSETAKLADYVLPASSQYEKAEATFFNFEFPHNVFQLRQRIVDPLPGTLSEAEIHARICEALGVLTDEDLQPLREAAAQGPEAYGQAMMMRVITNARLSPLTPVILYRTLALPESVKEGAVMLGVVLKAVMSNASAFAKAGFDGPPMVAAEKLFQALLRNPSGVVYAEDDWDGAGRWITTDDRKLHLALDDMLAEWAETLERTDTPSDDAFPFVLSAGERRSFTANTIIRDPAWRKKDPQGTLRLNPSDAASLGVTDGGTVRVTTKRGTATVPAELTDTMRPGHCSLPNGLGLSYPKDGKEPVTGVAPNELTASEDRDKFVGTPWHKHVRARLEAVAD
jgi:anaerobic selenocysteine-containing dehydrogenase